MAKKKVLQARLIGHVFGDGSIHKRQQYFIYTNSTIELQKEVHQIVKKLYGNFALNIGKSIAGTPRYQYSNKIGKDLVRLGSPNGSKISQKIEIPEWIMNGEKEIQSAFLGTLFDDDGYFRNSKNSNQIVFKAARTSELKTNLIFYLNQIRDLLKFFDIACSDVKSDQVKIRKDGKEITSLRFWIGKKEYFKKFYNNIRINHPEKRLKLKSMFMAPTR